MTEPLRVGELKLSADRLRATAMVDGAEIFFESDDVPLVAAPEALAGAMLLSAMQTRRPLVVEGALEAGWLENAEKLSSIFGQWWDYPRQSPIVRDRIAPAGLAGPATSIGCFTAGVDSFYMQLKGDHPTDNLLFVHGYDIPLDDTTRFTRFRESFDEIAREMGKRAIIVRTNLSRHPTFLLVSWERNHAAALAAVAHVLGGLAGTFVIPSTFALAEDEPWGSHWQTDPLWSSSCVKIVAGDANVTRPEKILALANEPLAQRHLRVCYSRKGAELNCSRCPKCLRTMTLLMTANALHQFTAFDHSVPIVQSINAIDDVDAYNIDRCLELTKLNLPPEVIEAWRGVAERTRARHYPSLLRRTVRRIRGMIKGKPKAA